MADKQDKHEKPEKQRAEYSYINYKDEIKRLNRVIGQVEGVQKMLDEQRKLRDVLIQCKAIHSALRAVEYRVFRAHVEVALDEIPNEKKKTRAEKLEKLEELFKHAD